MAESHSTKASKDNKARRAEGHPPKQPDPAVPAGVESEILALQRSVGNRGVGSLLERGAVSRPGDASEQEAERVARRALQMPAEPAPERAPAIDRSKPHGPSEDGAKEQEGGHAQQEGGHARPEGGQPLPDDLRAYFEPRFGRDFSQVRVHRDDQAARSAAALNARAYTLGRDVVFGPGQYAPHTQDGKTLLAHELTHVVQQAVDTPPSAGASPLVVQRAAPQIQRDLFGGIWEGIKSAGQAIGGALTSAAEWVGERARDVGSFLTGAAEWLGERVRDAATWVVNLIRDLPDRLARLASTLWEGLSGVVTFIPEAIRALAGGGLKGFGDWLWEKAKAGGKWILKLVSRVFDVLGGPELVEFIWHIVTKARPLTGKEIAAASSVLGPEAIRWGDVRVSQGGLLELVFALNEGRAFVMFHTVNFPEGESIDVMVHELTHVYQYERVGGIYLGQAIHAQIERGAGAYNYGGPAGLVKKQKDGKHFRDFNREEQAEIAQDYYKYVILGKRKLSADERKAYEFFIGELRSGKL